ncbi:tetratricopeptide repeat protein [Flavobacterium sp. CAN_S2]|uniref:tetratricopeptide repeat protein n=1 Tax=Flavobacterium sp. CAN_S2 TaxID=2787726 RepID=UPI0018CAA374
MSNKILNTKLSRRLKPNSKTIGNLLLRSGNECAFPGCSSVIFNDKNLLIAECCHIEAAMPGGERFNVAMTDEQRRSYPNLIFLCHEHHTETNDTTLFTVEKLQKIKNDHEERFKEKNFSFKPDYVQQVLNSFEDLQKIVKKTVEIVARIEEGQDKIFKILQSSESPKESANFENVDFFGPPPTFQFKGRNEEKAELDYNLKNYNTFIVGGISGIGKTTFLSNYVANQSDYKVFWIDCELVTTLEILALRLYNFAKHELGENYEKLVSAIDHDLLKITTIAILNKHKICIVFDALNASAGELFSFIQFLNKHLSTSKILISTNIAFEGSSWDNPIFKLPIKGVDETAFKEILEVYNVLNLSTEQAQVLYNLIDGHPYLIKLISTILEYEPLDALIKTLQNKSSQEISHFIKTKVFKFLTDDDLLFVRHIMMLGIPFRFSIGTHILNETFKTIFKSLKQKFIIEDFQEQFYIIPDFIKNNNLFEEQELDEIGVYKSFTEYLKCIPDPRLFERNATIYHALNAGLHEIGYQEAANTLSQLMAYGKFNIACNVANSLESHPIAKKWDIIYYFQGRVYRFQENYKKALEKYEQGIYLNQQSEILNVLNFEKATMLIYLSDDTPNDKFRNEAMTIYERLSKSTNLEVSIQSQTSMVTNLVRMKKYNEAIFSLESQINSFESQTFKSNVKAQVWQLLGEVYIKIQKYDKALECFDISCDLYKEAESHGMNIIDGLFHLYHNYAVAYRSSKHYNKAAQMYALCVKLSTEFDLPSRLEKSLFDLGYNLILAEDFETAAEVLDNYYAVLVGNNFITDVPIRVIYGALFFANWYNGDFEKAIELMGLMIMSCFNEGIFPPIAIMERDGMHGEINFLEFFQQHAYTLIIPTGKTHRDLKIWIDNVCKRRPDLSQALSSFGYAKKE